jgi:hypothetical protein
MAEAIPSIRTAPFETADCANERLNATARAVHKARSEIEVESNVMRLWRLVLSACALCAEIAAADPAAQLFERPVSGARDARLNRVIDARPSTAPSGFGAARMAATAGASATAIGNVLSVTQSGFGNTLVLSVTQRNDGAVAAGAALNGSLSLD